MFWSYWSGLRVINLFCLAAEHRPDLGYLNSSAIIFSLFWNLNERSNKNEKSTIFLYI